ncbi:MAG: hypothetical protein JSU06_08260 [Actinobacteria bacterium]|nr:hypothetical protein [Actinomycetota bacterium]
MSLEPRSHPVAIVVALALATLAGVVAIASIWANDQLLDTGSWVATSGRMIENPEVRHRVAAFLGEELTAQTEAQLGAAGQGEIAEQVLPRLRRGETALAERVIATPQFGAIWREANRSAHRALVRVLDEEGNGEAVVVNLTPALRRLADALGETPLARELGVSELGSLVAPGAARIKVLEAEELSQAQEAVRVVRDLKLPAVLVALAFYALALWLGRRRLSRTLVGVGLALGATGGLALLARALAGHQIVDRLLASGTDREAAEAAWQIATSKIADLAGLAIGLGAVIVLLVAAVAIFRKAAEQRTVAV